MTGKPWHRQELNTGLQCLALIHPSLRLQCQDTAGVVHGAARERESYSSVLSHDTLPRCLFSFPSLSFRSLPFPFPAPLTFPFILPSVPKIISLVFLHKPISCYSLPDSHPEALDNERSGSTGKAQVDVNPVSVASLAVPKCYTWLTRPEIIWQVKDQY